MKRVGVLLLAAGTAMAGDWPQFRGPSASGVGDGAKPPVHWDAAKNTNVVWKTEISGLSVSSPVVWGDRIFLTTAYDGGQRQSVLAYRRTDGKLLWETFVPAGGGVEFGHPKNSHASATPVTASC